MPAITRDMSKTVTILMGVLNGARWLHPQLNSIAEQDHEAWVIRFSDDGSTDLSVDIIAGFSEQHPDRVHRGTGPKSGFGDNYMQLIRDLPKQAGYTAFADQDDIWIRDKLGRAVGALARSGEKPALYCGRRWLWYPKMDRRIKSPQPSREFGFRNALIENVAAGNTVMLNPAAARLARQAARFWRRITVVGRPWPRRLIPPALAKVRRGTTCWPSTVLGR